MVSLFLVVPIVAHACACGMRRTRTPAWVRAAELAVSCALFVSFASDACGAHGKPWTQFAYVIATAGTLRYMALEGSAAPRSVFRIVSAGVALYACYHATHLLGDARPSVTRTLPDHPLRRFCRARTERPSVPAAVRRDRVLGAVLALVAFVASIARHVAVRRHRSLKPPRAPLDDDGVPCENARSVVVPHAGDADVMHTVLRRTATSCAHMRATGASAARAVTVRTRAAGVNYADVCLRWGVYSSSREYVGWPIVPGFEFAGTVVHVGDDVTDVRVGDEVFGVSLFGAYSTHVTVPVEQVFPRPKELSPREAAAFPTVALTAWAAYDMCHLSPGATVLVHSAAGGVGSMLCQLGKVYGHTVVGVVGSSHKVDHGRAMGCDAVIDKSCVDVWDEARRIAPGGYDAIFDANGGASLRRGYDHLARPGKLVVYGFHTMLPKGRSARLDARRWLRLAWDYATAPRFNPLHMVTANRSVLAFNLSFLFHRHDEIGVAMSQLVDHVRAGRLRPPVVTAFPLDAASDAHAALETGQTTGKLVLVTESDDP